MNRQVNIIKIATSFLLMLGVFAACSMEEAPDKVKPSPQPDGPVNVALTRAGVGVDVSNIEDSVATARLIVVEPSGKIVVNDPKTTAELLALTRDATSSPPKRIVHIVFTDSVQAGYNSFFTITNEIPGWVLDSSTYYEGQYINVEDLKRNILTFSSYPNVDTGSPIPMVGIYENLWVHTDGVVYKDMSLTEEVNPCEVNRVYAQVKIKLDCDFSQLVATNGGAPIEVKSVGIKRMPKYSFMAPIYYTLSDFVDGLYEYEYSPLLPLPSNKFNYTSRDLTPSTGGFQTSEMSFYVPEYLLLDTAKYTYIEVKTNLVGQPTSVVTYRIVVGDGIDPNRDGLTGNNNAWMLDPTSSGRGVKDLTIQRNTRYNFIAHIKGFNISGDQVIEIHPRVLHWDEVNNLDEIDIVDYQLTLSQDVFFPPATGYSGVVNITTDYSKGWRVKALSGSVAATLPGNVTPVIDTYVASGKLSFTYTGSSPAYITVATGPGDKIKKNIYINTSGLPGSGDD